LKLTLKKAFDKVEYPAIIAMLKAKGYSPKWINLVNNILHSASTSVFLNGVPSKNICKRGVRQGDVSPLLFFNTFEFLQAAINNAWQPGHLGLPIAEDYCKKYPILQYADDTLIIMPANLHQLNNLKEILTLFSASTGLQVNYHKTTLVPITIDNEHAQVLAQAFGRKVESLKFTYLGLPPGTTRPYVNDDATCHQIRKETHIYLLSNDLYWKAHLIEFYD
jgi:hypothetical protein